MWKNSNGNRTSSRGLNSKFQIIVKVIDAVILVVLLAIVHASAIAVLNACTIAIVHACTIAIVHACTIAIVHAYVPCPTVLMFDEIVAQGSGGRSPPAN